MFSKNILNVLMKHNYNMMKNTTPQYLFFCKQTNDSFSTIVLVDDSHYTKRTDQAVLCSIKNSLEKTFLLRGYKDVEVLFVIFTDTPFDYKSVINEEITFWLADTSRKRLISYSLDDGYFNNIRNELENAIASEPSRPSLLDRIKGSNGIANPIFTILFALANIIVFLYLELFGDVSDTLYVYANGACEWYSVLENNEYYRLFTCMFIHFGFPHLSSNMITLLSIGSQLEPSIGHIKFILIYVLSGLCASFSSVLYHWQMDSQTISAGASGAIFGIFGAYAICALFDKKQGKNIPATRIALISLLSLANGMTNSNIDNAAHLGGIISGCIIAFICCICRKNKI